MKKISFILITAVVVFTMYSCSPYKTANESKIATSTMARKTTIYDYFTFKGVLTENNKSELALPKTAKITNIYVNMGDSVVAGDKIADLEYLEDTEINYPEMYSTYKSDILNGVSEIDILDPSKSTQSNTIFADATDYSVYAPISGTVMELNMDVGEVVFAANPVAVISDLSKLTVRASINEDRVKRLKEGMKSEIFVDALSEQTFGGELLTIAPYAKKVSNILGQGSDTQTDVWVSVSDANDLLRPGYTATVKVVTDTKENALVLPYECISQDENNNEYVLVINKQRIFERRYIKCGYELDECVEIVEGIGQDDIVAFFPGVIKEGSSVSKTVRNAKN